MAAFNPTRLARRLQVLEAHIDANDGRTNLAQLAIPTPMGLRSPIEYKLDRQAEAARARVISDTVNFEQYLDEGPQEWVDNQTNDDFKGMVNSIPYVVEAHTRKQLPEKLALHYRQKMRYIQRNAGLDKTMGGVGGDSEFTSRDLRQFNAAKNAVATYGSDDPYMMRDAVRRKVY